MWAMGPGLSEAIRSYLRFLGCTSGRCHILGRSASHVLLLDFPLPPLLLLPFPFAVVPRGVEGKFCSELVLGRDSSYERIYNDHRSGYVAIYPNRFVLTPRLVRNVNEPQLHPRRDSFLWTHGCIQP